MSEKLKKAITSWALWSSVATVIGTLLFSCYALGRVVDVARGPDRMDKQDVRMDRQDAHMEYSDKRITALEDFNATNTLTVIFLLKDMKKTLDTIQRTQTN